MECGQLMGTYQPSRGTGREQERELDMTSATRCQIILRLGQLLQLVPQFTEGVKLVGAPQNVEPALTFFSNLDKGPAVVDTSSPKITTKEEDLEQLWMTGPA
mgnify:CR=1 FL=1